MGKIEKTSTEIPQRANKKEYNPKRRRGGRRVASSKYQKKNGLFREKVYEEKKNTIYQPGRKKG